MADLAFRFLPKENMPKGVLKASHGSFGKALYEHLTTSSSDNVIMFDDGAYSGTQLKKYLTKLKTELRIGRTSFAGKKNIYVVLGYSNKDIDWKAFVRWQEFEENNVHVEIIWSTNSVLCLGGIGPIAEVEKPYGQPKNLKKSMNGSRQISPRRSRRFP